MRKLITKLAVAFSALALCSSIAYADDGLEFSYFYDFENYKEVMGSGVGPDNHWGAVTEYSNTTTVSTAHKNFGVYNTDEEGYGKAVKINYAGEPTFFFDQLIKTGSLHISFDAKCTDVNGKKRLLVKFYDGRNGELPNPRSFRDTSYSKSYFINNNDRANSLNWYQTNPGTNAQDSMYQWNLQTEEADFDSYNWHHYDIISTDMGLGSSAYMTYYVDGRKINEHPVYFMGQTKGFYTLSFLVENVSGGTSSDGHGFLIDNVAIKRFYGGNQLTLFNTTKGERVALSDGRLSLRTSEKIDPTMISKDVITIKNSVDGSLVENFEIENVTDFGFEIAFSGELYSGKYELSLAPEIVGEITKAPLITPLAFQTEFKYTQVGKTYMNEDFESYTDSDGTLPEGFFRQDETDEGETFAKAVENTEDGKTTAFGFEFSANDRALKKYVSKFDVPITAGNEFEVSFDVFAEGLTWNFYLLENADFDLDNPDYLKNSLLSVNAKTGAVKYSSDRRTTPNLTLSGVSLENGWHNVKIKVVPDMFGNTADLTFTFDNDTENSVTKTVSRDFSTANTAGIAIGFQPVKDSKVYFDNFKAESNLNVMYPEATDISIYDRYDEEIEINGRITTMVAKATIEFSTLIEDSEYIKDIVVFSEDGAPVDYTYYIENDYDKNVSVMTLDFSDGMLKPMRNYSLNVNTGIKSYYSQDVESFLEFGVDFVTAKDNGYFVEDFGYIEEDGECKIKFTKNTDDEGEYIYSIAVYDEVTREADGKTETVLKLVNYKAQIISLTAEDKGIFEYKIPMTCDSGKSVQTYLWSYPSMQKLKVGQDGSID